MPRYLVERTIPNGLTIPVTDEGAQVFLTIDLREGTVSAIPFADETFDFTFCQTAFKNFSEPVKAITEMYRVLKPKGLAAIVDLRRDAPPEEIEQEIKGMKLGRVGEMMTRGTF